MIEKYFKPIKILEETEFCEWIYLCPQRKNSCLEGYSDDCQIKKFYDKYGNYRERK